jgi:hypothetical protein
MLGQKVKEEVVVWECAKGTPQMIKVEKEWTVTDILYNGDIVLGQCNGEYKVLYQREPYVVNCNEPIILEFNKIN